jgi:hypothetical protein
MRMWQRSWGRRTEKRETYREHFDYRPIPTHTRLVLITLADFHTLPNLWTIMHASHSRSTTS